MKLDRLYIEKLYSYYDYEVKFNSDVTFLFGANGCGKTTVLNITEAIITGCVFKLLDYDFNTIKLEYYEGEKIDSIVITSLTKTSLNVYYNQENFIIEKIAEISENRRVAADRTYGVDGLRLAYFEKYSELINIKNAFNYVYLPLNRKTMLSEDHDEFMIRRPLRIRTDDIDECIMEPTVRDFQMIQIENLISNVFMKINTNISMINDKFRDQILKSFLDVDLQQKYGDFTNEYNSSKNSSTDIVNTKKSYIKILNDLKIITKREEKQYDNFFESLIKDIEEQKAEKNSSLTVPMVLKLNEIAKIKKIISIAEAMEQDKGTARRPVEVFLNTMNDFIGKGDDDKAISIDANGRIYFTTKSNKKHISIQSLSSGEKQLITFFANLIFRVKDAETGIFVVDEPELSLHLSWQKIFVEKTIQINKNIQLIFATHSPEFIGRQRNKMYKLEKKYNP